MPGPAGPELAAPEIPLIGAPREPSVRWTGTEVVEQGPFPRIAPADYFMSNDAHYFLSSSVSLLAMTEEIYTGAIRMPLNVDALSHDYEGEPIPLFNAAIRNHVLEWYEQSATVFDRASMAWSALLQSGYQIREFIAKVSYGLAVFAMTNDVPWREIAQPSVVDADMRRGTMGRWITQFIEQHARCVTTIGSLTVDQFLEMSRLDVQNNPLPEPIQRSQPVGQVSISPTYDVTRAKKVLRRGIALFERLFGPAIYDFIANRPCVIEGHRYHYSVSRNGDLVAGSVAPRIDRHVIPYRLQLLRRDGERLASCCVVFEKTPVIDQLIALALHVQSADTEVTLLHTIRFSHCTKAFDDDPFLMEIEKQGEVRFRTVPIPRSIANLDVEPRPLVVRDPVCPVEALVPTESERFQALRQRLGPVVRDHLAAALPMSQAMFELMENTPLIDLSQARTEPFVAQLQHVRDWLLAQTT